MPRSAQCFLAICKTFILPWFIFHISETPHTAIYRSHTSAIFMIQCFFCVFLFLYTYHYIPCCVSTMYALQSIVSPSNALIPTDRVIIPRCIHYFTNNILYIALYTVQCGLLLFYTTVYVPIAVYVQQQCYMQCIYAMCYVQHRCIVLCVVCIACVAQCVVCSDMCCIPCSIEQ